MRSALSALIASVLSAAYWWCVFATLYGDAIFAGDRAPGAAPLPDDAIVARALAIVVLSVAGYALLILVWRRLTARRG